jgi:hypothetical protein
VIPKYPCFSRQSAYTAGHTGLLVHLLIPLLWLSELALDVLQYSELGKAVGLKNANGGGGVVDRTSYNHHDLKLGASTDGRSSAYISL